MYFRYRSSLPEIQTSNGGIPKPWRAMARCTDPGELGKAHEAKKYFDPCVELDTNLRPMLTRRRLCMNAYDLMFV
jgi:hypothetical protein